MKSRTFTTDDLSEWFAYYDKLPYRGAYHNPSYLAQLEGNFEFPNAEKVHLFVLEDDDAFVYYPYFRRPLTGTAFDTSDDDLKGLADIVSSWYYGGPLLSDRGRSDLASAFLDAFSEHCRQSGIVAEFVRFDPNIRNDKDFPGLDPDFNRETIPVDLTQTMDEIWADFSSSNRTHIRTAQDAGFDVSPATNHDQAEAFHEIYSNAMEAKNAPQHYRFSLDFFAEMVLEKSELTTLLLTHYEGEVVGGSYLVHDGGTVHEYLRASNPDFWDLGLNNHLCYRAIEHMHERDFDVLDFQGGRPGVFQFKKSFSSDRREFYIARRVHDEDRYGRLVDLAADRGVEVDTEYFPAYREAQSN